MSKLGNVVIRKNSGGNVGARRRVNLIEGANITLTILDDGPGDEIDVTIASAGGAGTAWLDQFFPAVDTDSNKGTYATVMMADLVDTVVRQTFLIPDDIAAIIRAAIIVIPDAGGNLRWQVATNFGQICSNEDYQTHTDSIGVTVTAVTQDEIECIDFSAGLTGAVGGDLVGVEFTRTATNAADTIDDDVHYIGIVIQGST